MSIALSLGLHVATFISDVISKDAEEAGMLAYTLFLDSTKDISKK